MCNPPASNTFWVCPRGALGRTAAGDTLAAVSFDQLRYFVAVAEEGNIGRAARRLCICQPPLSRQIQQLETELGTRLFDRTPRGVRLLPSGVRLLPIARDILERVAAARRALDEGPARASAPPGSAGVGD